MLLRLALRNVSRLFAFAGAFLCLLPVTAARAQMDLISAETVSAQADLRLAGANGEKAWSDGGFGKGRLGGTRGEDWKVRPVAAEGSLIWQPRFGWSVSGTVVAAVQDGQDHPVDLVEAFLTFKPLPHGNTRISARAGLYWPQISLEHQGAGWTVPDMITPSAINSWVGEEIKVVGAEATLSQDIGAQRLSVTAGLFGFNDTAGTLIAFRGWALHDLKATAFGKQKLPPVNDFMLHAQAPQTRPTIEIDDRVGYYGRIEWRMAVPVTLSAFYYDNRGDPEAVTPTLQWGWDTRFWNLGARADLDDHTRILAQALVGKTEMGFEEGEHYWVETHFRAAYLRLTHDIGTVSVSGRVDLFDTRERGSEMARDESEKGWAATTDVSWKLSDHVTLLGEVLHIDSKRRTRDRIAVDPHQKQTIIQASLRLSF